MIPTSLDQAIALDACDPLRDMRTRFRLPEDAIYLDGNSLGPLPVATPAVLARAAEREWGDRLIRSWNEADWIGAPRRIGDKIARLLGAGEGEVVAPGCSTSVALFQILMAAAQLGPGAIVAEADNFPTDTHIAEECARLLGRPFRMVAGGEMAGALAGAAAAVVTQVNYRTGARADMRALEDAAAAAGARIVWDLSHSAGAIAIDLARDGASLAVGCGYKFLNGGPGAPAWLYAARPLHDRLRSPIAGWWGHAEPFAFESGFRPAPGIDRLLSGTPPMLSLLALEPGIDLWLAADREAAWRKSAALFDLFAARVAALAPDLALVSPREAGRRGSQIAFAHPQAYAIVQALIDRGVIGDFRAPDVVRFGLTPLYTRFADIWRATEAIGVVMRDEAWRDPRFDERQRVT